MIKILEEKSHVCADGKTRVWIKSKCSNCKKIVWRQKRWVKNYKDVFCSRTCLNNSRTKKVSVSCANCGKKILKIPAQVKLNKTGLFFCDRRCKNQAQHEKKLFDKTKILNCYKCGGSVEADYRASKKLCKKCNPPTRPKEKIDFHKVLLGEIIIKYYNSFRKFLLKTGLKQNKCDDCGISKWRGKPLIVQIHHDDGNIYNNKLENLKMLCPNCHSQTPTWGTKNKKR